MCKITRFILSIAISLIPLFPFAQTTVCEELPDESKKEIIASIKSDMIASYGLVSKDSVEAICNRFYHMMENNTFFIPSIEKTWVYDTTPFPEKIKSLTFDCKTQADSAEKICSWIASRYPYGDNDENPDFANRSLDSTWVLMNQGNITGLCKELSVFFSLIVKSYFSHWGTPIIISSSADTLLTRGGTLPSHVWVGLCNARGEIYAVCDPTIGGIVKNKQTGALLSLDETRSFLGNPEQADIPYIHIATSRIQSYGPDCIPAPMLLDRETPIYYNTPIEIVQANWRSPEHSLNQCIPYWASKKLFRPTFMNVYLDISDIWTVGEDSNVVETLRNVYLKKP